MLNVGLKILSSYNWLRHKEHPFAVIYFHRILLAPTPYCPDDWTVEQFRTLLIFLLKHFEILPISKALALQAQGTLPSRTLCLSFDDGYMDNYELAAPVLEELGLKASFFIATSGTEQGYLWGDKLANTIQRTTKSHLRFNSTSYALETELEKAHCYLQVVNNIKFASNLCRDRYLAEITSQLGEFNTARCMMTKEQLVSLAERGNDIGAHTSTHSILAVQDNETANKEIVDSIEYLNAILPQPTMLFAYPNGQYPRDFGEIHEKMVLNAGAKYGFSTNDGGVTASTPKTRIPRFMPYRKELNQFCLSLIKIAGE